MSAALQTALNTIVAFMREQGRQSSDSNGCVYRAEDGAKCAVGCLITDEQMRRYFVPNYAAVMHLNKRLIQELVPDPQAESFLRNMQGAHDRAHTRTFLADFEAEARDVAERFGLEYPAAAAPTTEAST